GGGTTINAASTLQGDTNGLQGAIHDNSSLIFNQSFNGTYSGVINGGGTVGITGTGAVTFTGINTYSGATTVSAGSLIVNGSISNSAVTVMGGALLGGSGTVGPLTTSGIIDPGAVSGAVGQLNVNGTA